MEENLLDGLRGEDKTSFQKIYNLYAHKVYKFVYKYCKNDHEAQRMVQNVFVQLWSNRKNFHDGEVLDIILFNTAKQEVLKWNKTKTDIWDDDSKNE